MCLLQDVDPLEAIELELEEEDDAAVFEWFYDDKPLQHTKFVNGPSYSRWRLPLPVMSNLYRLAGQLLSDMTDLNYFYLFNTQVLLLQFVRLLQHASYHSGQHVHESWFVSPSTVLLCCLRTEP